MRKSKINQIIKLVACTLAVMVATVVAGLGLQSCSAFSAL